MGLISFERSFNSTADNALATISPIYSTEFHNMAERIFKFTFPDFVVLYSDNPHLKWWHICKTFHGPATKKMYIFRLRSQQKYLPIKKWN